MTTSTQDTIARLSRTHGVSVAAVEALVRAMQRGGGTMAQFNHPDLGGMGQWSSGGMLMIGDMFNDRLKAVVAGLCNDVARGIQDGSLAAPAEAGGSTASQAWWPKGLGEPGASGAQGGMRYAVFPQARRLAVSRDGHVTLYDTGTHVLSGVSQQQGGSQSLSFSSQHGPVPLDSLPVIDG